MEQSSRERTQFYHILTRKIMILILVVSFVPMILTTGILFYRFNRAYTEKIKAHGSELVQKHSRNIDTFLAEKVGNIRYLAHHFSEEFHFNNTFNADDDPISMLQIDEVKRFLSSRLTYLNEEYCNVFTDLGLVSEKGIQFAYEGPFRLENADYSTAEWFNEAKGKPYFISDVFAGLRGYPHFIITVPVDLNQSRGIASLSMEDGNPLVEKKKQDGDGLKGNVMLLRATINFAAFNERVENIHIGKTGMAFILNGKGEPQTRMDLPPDPALISSVLSHAAGRKGGESDFITKDYFCVTSTLHNIDWVMVFRQDRSDAFRDLRKTQILALCLLLIGSAAIISVAIILPRNIVKRISGADQKSEEMNRQVIESGKLATIGELAAGIAHEINNPVAIMVEEAGWMDDLMDEEDLRETKNFDEFKRALKQIDTQGRRCKEITHKLLSFARKTDATINDVQINDVIREIVALTGQMAKYNCVTLETDLHDGLPFIRISPAELQQVMLNLINNAIDAMEKSGGHIRIETKISSIEKEHVVVAVEDDGPGIPKENLERIFDPFFTTKPVGKGTGLGLSICYGIIRKLGGNIDVRSEVGVGTRFRIWIPFQDHVEAGGDDAMDMEENEHRERAL